MQIGDLFEFRGRVFRTEKVYEVRGHPVSVVGANLTPQGNEDERYWGISLEGDEPVLKITRH